MVLKVWLIISPFLFCWRKWSFWWIFLWIIVVFKRLKYVKKASSFVLSNDRISHSIKFSHLMYFRFWSLIYDITNTPCLSVVIHFSLSEDKSSLLTSRSRRCQARWGKTPWLMDIPTRYHRFDYVRTFLSVLCLDSFSCFQPAEFSLVHSQFIYLFLFPLSPPIANDVDEFLLLLSCAVVPPFIDLRVLTRNKTQFHT